MTSKWTLLLIHLLRTMTAMTLTELTRLTPLAPLSDLHTVEPRLAAGRAAPAPYRALDAFDRSIDVEPRLRELIRIRASQLNGCAYFLDEHTRDARAAGEGDRRVATLGAWRESVYFTARERAALALSDEVTRIGEHGVSDAVWAEVRAHFDEGQTAQLLWAIIAINCWNRLAVATHMVPEL
jgi:AhpD family alkylhydroperoxidase